MKELPHMTEEDITWNDEAIARCLAEEEEEDIREEDEDDWTYWASSDFGGDQVENDEAIAACLAAEFEAADRLPEKKSFLEVAAEDTAWQKPVPRRHNRQRTVREGGHGRTERSAIELERSARRIREESLFARRDSLRCCGIERKQVAQALRDRADALRNESCACYLAARNPNLVPFPAPFRYEDAVRVLAQSLTNEKECRVDLHMLPRTEALAALEACMKRKPGPRRLRLVVGRGTHSRGPPILGPAIRAYLNRAGTRYDYDQIRGVILIHLS